LFNVSQCWNVQSFAQVLTNSPSYPSFHEKYSRIPSIWQPQEWKVVN
jgi:hypothetical protein